jgi:hypothetical protein
VKGEKKHTSDQELDKAPSDDEKHDDRSNEENTSKKLRRVKKTEE